MTTLGWKQSYSNLRNPGAAPTEESRGRIPFHAVQSHDEQRTQVPVTDIFHAVPDVWKRAESREMDRPKFLGRIAVKLDDKLVLVHLQDVFWIQSKGNLLCLHLRDADYDCRMTMSDLHLRLDPECFLRVHRNAIVNLDHVLEFNLPRNGNAFVHLRNGKALPISRTGRLALRRSLLSRSYTEADAS